METSIEVPITEVFSHLSALSKKLQAENRIRASLFTLVLYSKQNLPEGHLHELTRAIIRKFPCRLLLVRAEENPTKSFLRSYVSSLHPEEGSPTFCDMIRFDVGGEEKKRIPFVLLPHLLTDLPLYLLWLDDPLLAESFSLHLPPITRTIFDSASSTNFVAFTKLLLHLHQTTHTNIGDLNWARCASWRALFSHTFTTKERLSCLLKACEIEIIYNAQKIPALYLQAWLATCLQWQYQSSTDSSFSYLSNEGPLTIQLSQECSKTAAKEEILRIRCKSSTQEEMLFARDPNFSDTLLVRHSSLNSCELPFLYRFSEKQCKFSIAQEIYYMDTSVTFLKVLQFLSETL